MSDPNSAGACTGRRRTRRCAIRPACLWVAAALPALLLAGCLAGPPVAPRPDTVYVPPPDRAPADEPAEALLERYAASPNRDPDGLGVLPTVWLQSRMILVPRQARLELERRNRLAYARDEAQQAAALAVVDDFFDRHVLFEGWLIGDLVEGVQPQWYLPEGVYLVDDRGRKFLPLSVENQVQPAYYQLVLALSVVGTGPVNPQGYPRIVFPREAIGPETRAVTLYLAALFRRMSFTWVFDPDYVPAAPAGVGAGEARGPWRR